MTDSPASTVTTVFLDLDGTLTDPADGITRSIAYALERLDLPVPPRAELETAIGPPLWEALPGFGVPPEDIDRAVVLYRERYTDVGLFENTPYDGVFDMLEALRAEGLRLALATSKPIAYAARITARFGLADYLDFEFGSEMDGVRADKRDLLAYALAETGADPARSAMLGDRLHDARGALHNGITSLGALWGYGSHEELTKAGVHAVVEAPAGVVPAVRAIGR